MSQRPGRGDSAAGRTADVLTAFTAAEQIALAADLPLTLARTWEDLAHEASAAGDQERVRTLWTRAAHVYPDTAPNADHSRVHLESANQTTVRCGRCFVKPPAHVAP